MSTRAHAVADVILLPPLLLLFRADVSYIVSEAFSLLLSLNFRYAGGEVKQRVGSPSSNPFTA